MILSSIFKSWLWACVSRLFDCTELFICLDQFHPFAYISWQKELKLLDENIPVSQLSFKNEFKKEFSISSLEVILKVMWL